MPRCHVYLVPGFFGFTSVAGLTYFQHVSAMLEAQLTRRGLDAKIVECPTIPAGSIRHRADRLLQQVIEAGGLEAEELHFVGHSTGGLDIRLLLTPNVQLRPGDVEAEVAGRTRTATTIATPHYGTPIADFFTLLPGRQALELLARAVTSPLGRVAVVGVGRALGVAGRIDAHLRRETILDAVSQNVLRHLTLRADDPVFAFLRQVSVDQAAIVQVTPECMDIFNAAVVKHPRIAYGCVVTGAPAPPAALRPDSLLSPERVALGGLFMAVWFLASREHKRYPYPMPSQAVLAELEGAIESPHSPATNDGIVPTLSQIYGDVVAAVLADHLDVIGQFERVGSPLGDWLPSGSGFDAARFDYLWSRVADRIAGVDRGRGT